MSDQMRARWMALCRRLGPRDDPNVLWRELEALYAQPVRAYHSLVHIEACLDLLDEFRPLAVSVDLVEFALWLHDCVYDPRAGDNEDRSATVAREFLDRLGAGTMADQVTSLILVTRHTGAPDTPDEALVADLDLSILGAEPEVYARYAAGIRSEYSFATDEVYRAGRAGVLRGLLARARLYQTEQLRDRFERTARENMRAELDALTRER